MFKEIKNKIENEIPKFLNNLEKQYSLSKLSPLLIKCIKKFAMRRGKRIRPTLFVVGYQGFSNRNPSGLYTSALSIELFHDFMLVHDDIIDKSPTRRGLPSMHVIFNKYLKKFKDIKFSGSDLSIVTGDIMYAMAVNAFLYVEEDKIRKEKALRNLTKAAIFTGCGEFIELLSGTKQISQITKDDIYKIYDYKTAYYTFASPLSAGAILAGLQGRETDKLIRFGILLGRIFQIRDDILGIFGDEKKIGKSVMSDLQEAKKTLLLWHTYNNSLSRDKILIQKILKKDKVTAKDLFDMRKLMQKNSSLDYAEKEVRILFQKAKSLIPVSMKPKYKEALYSYAHQLTKKVNPYDNDSG